MVGVLAPRASELDAANNTEGIKELLVVSTKYMLLTALPEVLRAAAGLPMLPAWVGPLLRDGRTIIYGILIVLVVVVFPQGLITPNLFRRKRGDEA